MKKILLIHGPNLNLLGQRDQALYGDLTLAELTRAVEREGKDLGAEVVSFQSNSEGALIDMLQKNRDASGVIINPGALSHYSYALHDALLDMPAPKVEVHLSDIDKREEWRRISVTARACEKLIKGKKLAGYLEAIRYLCEK